MRTGTPTLRRLAVFLAVSLAALALALAIVEIAVRMLGLAGDAKLIDVTADRSVYTRSTNPILGFELKADYRDPDADLVSSFPYTNAHGQRDVERTFEKAPGIRRIIMLGASVVEGIGIRDLDDMISRRLEKLYDDGRTQVLNFGVSAYCTRAKVELLRVKGMRFDPDLVLLLFTENDFNNFNHEAFRLGSPVRRPFLVDELFIRWHTFRALCTRLNLFYFGAQIDPVTWNRKAIGDNNVVEGLALLASLSEQHEFDPMIAVWPHFEDEHIIDPHAMPDRPDELIVERLAAMHAIPVFRISHAFATHWAAHGKSFSPRRRYTVGDRLHPSVEGCRLAAEALKGAIDDLEALRASARRRARSSSPDTAAVDAARTRGSRTPDYSRVYVNTANTLYAQGKVDEAIHRYRQALRIKPYLAEAHNNLGVALKSQGRLDEAIEHYHQALTSEPNFAQAHNNLGTALAARGDMAGAVEHFRRAVAIKPDYESARRNLVLARRRLNQER
ncbi:MAG: hypothetical protein CMJ18_01550 [Phycisphaeraceae bacterium]|nr:hypothetical protein [Phycisphaeraceae bacterium]